MRLADIADAATAIEEREREASIARASAQQPRIFTGNCGNCGGDVRQPFRYCDADCRDDAEMRARRRC